MWRICGEALHVPPNLHTIPSPRRRSDVTLLSHARHARHVREVGMENERFLEASSLLGITASVGMLMPAFFMAELAFLALPGLALLVPSLLYGTR